MKKSSKNWAKNSPIVFKNLHELQDRILLAQKSSDNPAWKWPELHLVF